MPIRILIVDDEVETAERIGKRLVQMDFVVDLAPDGEEGLEKFRQHQYDAIILDIRMPGMNGIELLTEIRLVAEFVPVIMLTGHAGKEDAMESARKHVFDFVEKPIKDWEGFLNTVERAARTKDPILSSMEEWVSKLSPEKRQEPLIFEGMDAYSPEELLKEVRKNTELGQRLRENFGRLVTDLNLEKI